MLHKSAFLFVLLSLFIGCEGEMSDTNAPDASMNVPDVSTDAAQDSTNDAAIAQDAAADALADSAQPDGSTDAEIMDVGSDVPVTTAWTCPGEPRSVVAAELSNILPAIQTAAADANEGDCLVLPAGEFYAEGTATITKKVSLLGHGAGADGTWIRRAETYPESDLAGKTMIRFEIDSREPSGIVVAGIRLSSKDPQRVAGDGGSLATDFGIFVRGAVDFVITACHFENFGYGGVQIKHFDDLSRGLIYNNKFTHNLKGDGQGLGYGVVMYGEDLVWLDDPQFGSDNFIFIEDNYFFEHRHALAAGGAARYVVRHSEIIDNLWGGGAGIDAHEGRNVGPGGSNHFATRAVEAYDNVLRNDHFRDGAPIIPGQDLNRLGLIAIGFRGGEQLAYNNHISGYLNGILLIVFKSQPDTWGDTTYPYPYQIGWLSGEALGESHSGTGAAEGDGDFFEWNNTFVPYAPTGQERKFWLSSSTQLEGALKEGRDYHLDTPKPGYVAYPYPHPGRINWQGIPAE